MPTAPPISFPVHCIRYMVASLNTTPPTALHESHLPSLERVHRGKVRDVYAIDADSLLIVATDRLSAFDVILPDPIPGKGRILKILNEDQRQKFEKMMGEIQSKQLR